MPNIEGPAIEYASKRREEVIITEISRMVAADMTVERLRRVIRRNEDRYDAARARAEGVRRFLIDTFRMTDSEINRLVAEARRRGVDEDDEDEED